MKILTKCSKCGEIAVETKVNHKPNVAYETDCHNCAHGVIQYKKW